MQFKLYWFWLCFVWAKNTHVLEPGDFLLEKTRYHAVDGKAEVTIVRINGSDGDIKIEYSTL